MEAACSAVFPGFRPDRSGFSLASPRRNRLFLRCLRLKSVPFGTDPFIALCQAPDPVHKNPTGPPLRPRRERQGARQLTVENYRNQAPARWAHRRWCRLRHPAQEGRGAAIETGAPLRAIKSAQGETGYRLGRSQARYLPAGAARGDARARGSGASPERRVRPHGCQATPQTATAE